MAAAAKQACWRVACRRFRCIAALLGAAAAAMPAPASPRAMAMATAANAAAPSARSGFEGIRLSTDARGVQAWVERSDDAKGRPYAIVDKVNARVFVFDAQARPVGTSAVLVGLALGDDSVPGIGSRSIASIGSHERSTPAGRFEASLDLGPDGEPILWIDYEGALALHPTPTGSPAEHRFRRLSSPDARQRRITYGCINVPAAFFHEVVEKTFSNGGVVYVLPETRSLESAFGMR